MKPRQLKRKSQSIILPALATLALVAFAAQEYRSNTRACAAGVDKANDCNAPPNTRASAADVDSDFRRNSPSPDGRRFSDHRIALLNDLMPTPRSGPELLREIEAHAIQQRRFERRYGPDSVAARSVRDRLLDLNEQAATGSRFAVQEKRGLPDD